MYLYHLKNNNDNYINIFIILYIRTTFSFYMQCIINIIIYQIYWLLDTTLKLIIGPFLVLPVHAKSLKNQYIHRSFTILLCK